MHEAKYYSILEDSILQCQLCPHYCTLHDGEEGRCRSRKNIKGKMYATNYAKTISLAFDPIEKKPLYHYRPGSSILSLGPNSCNLSCFYCQNHTVSQTPAQTKTLRPQELLSYMKHQNLKQVAFTYTEPLTWYEYISDFGSLSREESIDTVLVSNGYINPEPLQALMPYISALNIDLKGMDDSFYREHCGGGLQPVLETIKYVHNLGVHIEISNLLIPGLNTAPEQVQKLIDFVAELDRSIPLHFSKYHPAYKSKTGSTSDSIILSACEAARKKLHYVYAGNTKLDGFYDTICPQCQEVLVSNRFYHAECSIGPDGKCPACGSEIYGVYN